MRRTPKKLSPHHFLSSVLSTVAEGEPALREMAIQVGLRSNDTLAKQSLWERISTPMAVDFFKECVKNAFQNNLTSLCPVEPLVGIQRILIGDSSAVKLHRSLNESFPGGSNKNKQCAQVRLQCTLDLLSGQWVDGGFERYLRQDAKAAHDLVENGVLQAGDLVVRDLGYAVLNSFAEIAKKGAFYLSRLHPQWNIYADESGGKVDLIALLERNAAVSGNAFRMKIRIGNRQQLNCELIAVRVPEAVAATRRRRARERAKRKGVTYTKRYMKFQNWTLLVTNMPESSASLDQLCELYRLRWRIEMFFKACKSHTWLEKLACHRTNRYHAEVLLWAWLLLMIGLSGQSVFAMAEVQFVAGKKPGRIGDPPTGITRFRILNRSLFKIMPQLLRIVALSLLHTSIPNGTSLIERFVIQCEYHNVYEKRKSRISLPQRLQSILYPTA